MLKVSNDYWKNYWWFNYSSISIEIKFLNCFQHHYEIFGNHSCYAWLQSFKHLFDYVENMIMLLLNSGEPWLVYQKYSLHQNSIHSGKWRKNFSQPETDWIWVRHPLSKYYKMEALPYQRAYLLNLELSILLPYWLY